jgi:hypothetical protein
MQLKKPISYLTIGFLLFYTKRHIIYVNTVLQPKKLKIELRTTSDNPEAWIFKSLLYYILKHNKFINIKS